MRTSVLIINYYTIYDKFRLLMVQFCIRGSPHTAQSVHTQIAAKNDQMINDRRGKNITRDRKEIPIFLFIVGLHIIYI